VLSRNATTISFFICRFHSIQQAFMQKGVNPDGAGGVARRAIGI